jgi:hypothetical protein
MTEGQRNHQAGSLCMCSTVRAMIIFSAALTCRLPDEVTLHSAKCYKYFRMRVKSNKFNLLLFRGDKLLYLYIYTLAIPLK